jgi:heptosyltransferase-2
MAARIPAERLLVRCPNWVGDVVMATPALRCLRRNYPDARLTLLVRPHLCKLLEGAPWYDDVILYERPRARGARRVCAEAAGFRRAAREIGARRIDRAVLLTHSLRSALLAKLGGARRRLAYTRGDQSWLLTDAIRWPRDNGRRVPLPKVEAYLELCRYLGCEGADDTRQELFFSEADAGRAEALVAAAGGDGRPIFGIVPGASYGASKFWDVERFARVADALAERYDWQPALLCGPGELALGRAVGEAMTSHALLFPPEVFGLEALKPMVARCKLLVTTDSGPRHVGTAFDVPTVVLMGPTDPRHTQSDYARAVVVRRDVPCGPCHRRACPRDHACMKAITVEMVLDAATTLLEEAKG